MHNDFSCVHRGKCLRSLCAESVSTRFAKGVSVWLRVKYNSRDAQFPFTVAEIALNRNQLSPMAAMQSRSMPEHGGDSVHHISIAANVRTSTANPANNSLLSTMIDDCTLETNGGSNDGCMALCILLS